MTERRPYRSSDFIDNFPAERTQFRKFLEKGIEEGSRTTPIINIELSSALSGNHNRAARESIAILRTRQWLRQMFNGSIIQNYTTSKETMAPVEKFKGFLSDVMGGVDYITTPKIIKGEQIRSIAVMRKKLRRLNQRNDPHSLQFLSQNNLRTRAGMLGARIAIELSEKTLKEMEEVVDNRPPKK